MSSTGCYDKNIREKVEYPHTKFFTRFVAYPNPSSPSLYQPTASLSPGPCSLSEQSSLTAPIDPRARQAPVELVSVVTQPMRLLVPEIACEVHLPPFRSQGMLLASAVSAVGTCLERIPLEVDLSAVVFVGAVVFVVEIAIVAGVALDSGEIGDPNRSATM